MRASFCRLLCCRRVTFKAIRFAKPSFVPLQVRIWGERQSVVQSPDVELVEPEAVTVKEEKLEPNGSEEGKPERDVQLIGDDGKHGLGRITHA